MRCNVCGVLQKESDHVIYNELHKEYQCLPCFLSIQEVSLEWKEEDYLKSLIEFENFIST